MKSSNSCRFCRKDFFTDRILIRSRKNKKPAPKSGLCFEIYAGDHLISHTLSRAVPSAQRGLTSVFGMGTGGTLAVWSPANLETRNSYVRLSNLVGAWRAVSPAAESRPRAISPGRRMRQAGATELLNYQSAETAETFATKSTGLLQGLLNVFLRRNCAELILWTSRTGD